MEKHDFMIKYNYWLKRYYKACDYFNDLSKDDNEKLKHLDMFNTVVKNLSMAQKEYKRLFGRDMTCKEIEEGF